MLEYYWALLGKIAAFVGVVLAFIMVARLIRGKWKWDISWLQPEKLRTLAAALLSITTTIALPVLGYMFTQAIKEREVQGKFVELSVSILREKPVDEAKNLRIWATNVISRYSGVTLPEQTINDLLNSQSLPQQQTDHPPKTKISLDLTVVPKSRDRGVQQILDLAAKSAVANYQWKAGKAPIGYTKGIAAAYALSYCKWKSNDPISLEIGKAVQDEKRDALAYLNNEFVAAGMHNDADAVDTMRHVFVLLASLGMQETRGRYCEGDDILVSNPDENAAVGLFSSSYNATSAIPQYQLLVTKYAGSKALLDIFQEGVDLRKGDSEISGVGSVLEFQRLSKQCPAFAVEFAALGLRSIKSHWGPVHRRTVEITPACDEMLRQVQTLLDEMSKKDPQGFEGIRLKIMDAPVAPTSPSGA